ncbi:MAG: hypothetical protein WB786_07010 [Thermoplasmata archaeon]
MSESSAPATASPLLRSIGRLRHLGWVLLGMLVVECVIGIALTAYVSLPSSPSFMTVFSSAPLLTAHIVLAFLLFVVAVYATVLAVRLKVAGIAGWEGLVALFLLVAIQEGFAFSFNSNNMYVAGMVVGFLGALIAQVVVNYRLARRSREATSVVPSAPHAGTP